MKPRSHVPTRRNPGPQVFLLLLLLASAYPVWRMFLRAPQEASAGGRAAAVSAVSPEQSDAALISALVTDEETYLALTRKMNLLSRSLFDLRLPGSGADSRSVFAPSVTKVDLGPASMGPAIVAPGVVSQSWALAKSTKAVGDVDLWRPLLDLVSTIEHANFYLLGGEHPDGNTLRYNARAGFEALAKLKSGEWCSLHATMKQRWERRSAAGGLTGQWQITDWTTEEMFWNVSHRQLFLEVLDRALRPPQDPATLRRSQHYEATVDYYRGGMKKLPHPYFAPISVNQKEGLAVADVNGDGFDDIYITVRIGKNMLLINHGDGTFTEEAASYHLDLPGHTTCALFADFDNDGDLDVMLGRSLLRTSYLENRGGVFYQYPIPKFMPMAVI